MDKEEKQILKCAKKIKEYCTGKACKGCIFNVEKGCVFFENTLPIPHAWELPKNPPILDDVERDYLWNIIKPFKDKVDFICKNTTKIGIKGKVKRKEYIAIKITDDNTIFLPEFKKDTMYKGMKIEKEYTVEELFGGK